MGLAVGYNKVALVKVLIEGGADVSKTDAKGSTVLHYAAGQLILPVYLVADPCQWHACRPSKEVQETV